MKTTTLIILCCTVVFSAAGAGTGTVVAPANFATNNGTTGVNTLLRDSGNPRTYQMQLTPAALGGLPIGARITELGFRLYGSSNPTSYPPANITWPDYEVTLAQAANPIAGMSTNLAANMISPVQVKDGTLTLGANSFTLRAGTNSPFCALMVFDTPYVYRGGDLVMLFSHRGSDATSTAYLDAVGSYTPGYGTNFRAFSATSFNAAVGTAASLSIAQIVFTHPGTVVAADDFAATNVTTGVNTLLRNTGNPRTYQMQLTPAALGGLPIGALITELRFRLHTNTTPVTTFPAANITWPDYEVTLAQAANPIAAMSTDFAANMISPVLVKDGVLSLRSNTFTTSAGLNPFGTLVVFDTPYVYQGGDLVMLFSHPGSDSTSTPPFLDSVSSYTPGYGTNFRALTATSFHAAIGSAASLTMAQIVFTYPATVVVPDDFAAAAGTTGVNTLLRNSGNPRTYQMQLTPTALGGLPIGAQITELRFRLGTSTAPGTTFPATNITWSDYEVTLAQAANPIAAMSTDFAANMISPVRVKDGALSLRAKTFTTSAGINPFCSLVVFDTPYVYQGGDLIMLFSHPGSDSTSTPPYLDSVSSSTPGYGAAFRALTASSFHAASGSQASLSIAQIVYTGPLDEAISPEGSNVVISGAGGWPSATYRILTASDAALPFGQWTPVRTGFFDESGRFGHTNAVNPALPAQFFRLAVP
ncbi:MAG TPA: hypothetical protein VJA21_08110 [Verrucomicrobiae bacterium]